MHLIRLVYVSEGLPGMPWDELRQILTVATTHNARRGITGILCYGSGLFLQALEGDRDVVNQLYAGIQRDTRHANCSLVNVEDIHTRDFAEWSMKYVGWDVDATAQRRELLLRHSSSIDFDPRTMTGRQALEFLRELSASERLSPPKAA
jgi:hypothetical protein